MSKVYPVIHVLHEEQAAKNIDVAFKAGADGVFLINHGIYAGDLCQIFRRIRPRYDGLWIGVNYLGIPSHVAAQLAEGADGLWCDNVGDVVRPKFKGSLFISTAFKYQPQQPLEKEVKGATMVADPGDVIVTSGEATGSPPSVDKVKRILELVPGWPLGIASGLTPENVASFLPYASVFLVATGIGSDFHNLDPAKTKAFVEAARG